MVDNGCDELDGRIGRRELFKRTVEMVGAADIVTWDHGDEGSSTVGPCLL